MLKHRSLLAAPAVFLSRLETIFIEKLKRGRIANV